MIRENQVQQIAYKVDNSLYELINYQPTFQPAIRIDLQAVKRKLLVYQETIFLKRIFDILFSSVVLLAGVPVFLVLMLITKATSKGPAFYRQERIGKDQKPFYIYKFRSMRVDAEKDGRPQLASDDDPRITKWGKFMRKTHLDELPQFWNVLKGDMAIVGPRPERRHFINEIKERRPEYTQLFRLKPGITSIGQVHYGYAENVDQMCERVNYDLSYLSTMSLKTDIGIILETVKAMTQGKGK
ncbi:sugar transferase [Parapedobacter koreensis]|uniref:Sugar transferase involved in LPS biosynthesis (Colanic, teichoic acid) n=1 Tax=Parapedobacter koreensis TaxID=332977 RepID=A0A1H7U370_9SPHI|nr:sugar transferase [Parapedobacter koreensis]SEL91403.1 Sugar transferase involved in LPS biosynthesis (colanic, teichoic acid) [Parapedobacter koreensis]